MNFCLDENFPKSAYSYLTQRGHLCADVRDHFPQGADDGELFLFAQQHRAIFLTTDKDFYHTIPFLYSPHHGVVVISLHQPNRLTIQARLQWFLEHAPVSMKNTVYLLRDRTFVATPNFLE